MDLWHNPENENSVAFNDMKCNYHSNSYYCQVARKVPGHVEGTMVPVEGASLAKESEDSDHEDEDKEKAPVPAPSSSSGGNCGSYDNPMTCPSGCFWNGIAEACEAEEAMMYEKQTGEP